VKNRDGDEEDVWDEAWNLTAKNQQVVRRFRVPGKIIIEVCEPDEFDEDE